MHDLLNDLEKYISAKFCFRLRFDKGKFMLKTTLHFSFAFKDVNKIDGLGTLIDAERLRSLLPIIRIGNTYLCKYPWKFKISIHDLFSKIKFLHILSFDDCSKLTKVPDFVGDLKHLHSLNL